MTGFLDQFTRAGKPLFTYGVSAVAFGIFGMAVLNGSGIEFIMPRLLVVVGAIQFGIAVLYCRKPKTGTKDTSNKKGAN